MAKYLFFILSFSFFLQNKTKAQLIDPVFRLDGNINCDTGTIRLVHENDDIYYPDSVSYYETPIIKGKFLFTGAILYPYAFRLRYSIGSKLVYMSDVFFIDPGTQTITCNIDSSRELPILINNSMRELRGSYHTTFRTIELEYYNFTLKYDSLYSEYKKIIPDEIMLTISREQDRFAQKKDSVLLLYSSANPHSFVAMWKLIDKFSSGYKSIFDSIYDQLSAAIKNTYTGTVLAKKLQTASVVNVGNIFPRLLLLNLTNSKVLVPTNNHKYTLVDFWFSHCFPCISQFNKLKKLFEKYNNKGFDILGISTDGQEYITDWRNVIKANKLPWKQYLDLNSIESKKMSIYTFPTNFLIDDNGKIIAKNIELVELENLLEKNLN